MKLLRMVCVALAALAGGVTALPAHAHGYYHGGYYGGVRGYWYGPSIGFYYGGPYGWGAPGYYGPGYGYGYGYAVPSYGVLSPGAVVYIEREPPATPPPPAPAVAPEAAPGAGWWYLCSSPRGAYPYVRECPGGWERVPALPPGTVR